MGFGYFPPAGGSSSASGLIPSNNLSDLTSPSAARTNLGLGSAATANTSAFEAAGVLPVASSMFANKSLNLSDLSNAGTARTNLGLGTMGIRNSGEYLATSNNLSELASASTARSNLGLTNMSIWNIVPPASGGTGLSSLPTANYVLGGNSGGTAYENKNIVGGAGVSVTHSAGQVKFDKFNTPTSGTTLNLNVSNFLYKVMDSNPTLTVVSGTFGQDFQVMLIQDSVGNRTPTWFSTIRWITSGGTAPTIASGVGKVTYLGFRVTGTANYDGFLIGSNA